MRLSLIVYLTVWFVFESRGKQQNSVQQRSKNSLVINIDHFENYMTLLRKWYGLKGSTSSG